MRRLLAGMVLVALVAVVVAGCGSGAAASGALSAGRGRAPIPVVPVSPRLKRLLGAEISKLRATQPTGPPRAPRRSVLPRIGPPSAPPTGRGVPCFVAGLGRCSEIPCRVFVAGQAVAAPFVARRAAPIACPRAPRKLVVAAP